MFIGYAKELYEILKTPLKNSDDDQLFYTRAYLDADKRDGLKIQLDHRSVLFQNLYGATNEVMLKYNDHGEPILINELHDTKPSVIHGNGLSKPDLNNYGNYLAGAFVNERCMVCDENNIDITVANAELPPLTMAIFIEKATPFLDEFFDDILAIEYPKKKIDLFIHNAV